MRKCLRCGTEMKENCAIKVEGAGYGIIMSSDENKLFGAGSASRRWQSVRSVAKSPSMWKM